MYGSFYKQNHFGKRKIASKSWHSFVYFFFRLDTSIFSNISIFSNVIQKRFVVFFNREFIH